MPQRDPKGTSKAHRGAPKAPPRCPRDSQGHLRKTPKWHQMRRLSSGLRSQEMPPKRAQMVPEWAPGCRKDTPKNPPRVTKELPRHPNGTEEIPMDSPKSSQMLPNATPVERIGGPRNATKVHPDGAQGGQGATKGAQSCLQGSPRSCQGPPRTPKRPPEAPKSGAKWCPEPPERPPKNRVVKNARGSSENPPQEGKLQ